MIYNYKKIDSLKDFKKRKDLIGILEREVPPEAPFFFQKLNQLHFSISGNIRKNHAKEDIHKLTLRLVDALGNEGMSSLPVNFFLPRVIVAELSWGARLISPSVY